jgi:hypothetical protein
VPGNVFTLPSRFARFARVRIRKINAVNGALTSGPFFRKAAPAGTRVWNSNFRHPTVNNPCLVGRSLAWDEDGFWLTARRAVPTRCPFVTTRQRAVNTWVRGRRLEAFQRNSTIGAVFCVFSISRLAKRIYSCAGGLLTTGSLFARLSAEALDFGFKHQSPRGLRSSRRNGRKSRVLMRAPCSVWRRTGRGLRTARSGPFSNRARDRLQVIVRWPPSRLPRRIIPTPCSTPARRWC